ncbi:MAG TPA: hypothetical protein VGV06_15650 [Methylomirabilota bacterium]|nr:hypothetical protein [Methylomirabilota bacterium]
MVARVPDVLELDTLDLGNAAHPGALPPMEQAGAALGAEGLTDFTGTMFPRLQRAANLGFSLVNPETGKLIEGAVSQEKETQRPSSAPDLSGRRRSCFSPYRS